MRVLITGAGGQLGRDLQIHCESLGDEVVAAARADLDVGDRDAVYQAVTGVRPDVVLHAAAWTAVDACEGDPDRAYRVNALGARWVADATRRVGAYLCCVSTDYVFDGTKQSPYVEWDRPGPRSVYGASKLGGEQEVAAHAPGAGIVRTSWVCGEHGA
ncbi:MAG TPA: NAD(P)-dependent oxidoreductase, partial [Acidimicrobiales bacterium]